MLSVTPYVLPVPVTCYVLRLTCYVGTCYAVRDTCGVGTKYALRVTKYAFRGYPYTTSPRSLCFKVCFRVGNGFAFWN